MLDRGQRPIRSLFAVLRVDWVLFEAGDRELDAQTVADFVSVKSVVETHKEGESGVERLNRLQEGDDGVAYFVVPTRLVDAK